MLGLLGFIHGLLSLPRNTLRLFCLAMEEIGCMVWFTVTGVQVVSVGFVGCLGSGSENSRRGTDLPAALGDKGRGELNSHYRDANKFTIHIHLSNCLASLMGSNLGLSEGVCGYDKTASAVAMLGSVSARLAQSIKCL